MTNIFHLHSLFFLLKVSVTATKSFEPALCNTYFKMKNNMPKYQSLKQTWIDEQVEQMLMVILADMKETSNNI